MIFTMGKGSTEKCIEVSMLVTDAESDLPIIGYNVVEELINRDSNSVVELVSSIGDSFKALDKDDICAFVDFVRTEKESIMGYVKTGKKNTTIKSIQTASIPCRVNAGYIERPTLAMFEAKAGGLLTEIQFHDTLVTMKRGNEIRANLLCTNTGPYDCVLRGRTIIGCLKQIRSATPFEVKLVELEREDMKLAETGDKDLLVEFDEEEEPLVDLPEGLSNEQRIFVKKMLSRVKDVFCKSKDEVGCAKDLKLKLNLHDETQVQKNYAGVPLYQELKAYIEDLINRRICD